VQYFVTAANSVFFSFVTYYRIKTELTTITGIRCIRYPRQKVRRPKWILVESGVMVPPRCRTITDLIHFDSGVGGMHRLSIKPV